MTKVEQQRALDLMAEALPFLEYSGTPQDCAVCGEPSGKPHEKDCFVPKMKALVDKYAPDDRVKGCKHDKLGACDFCIVAVGKELGLKA